MVSAGLAQTKAKSQARPPTPSHIMIAPDAVKWVALPASVIKGTPSIDAGGTLQLAVLKGDPTKAEPFSIELQCSDGYKVAPHWHPTDENLFVLSGTFALATGDAYDPATLHDMTTGAYGFMPRRVHHFGLCKGRNARAGLQHGTFRDQLPRLAERDAEETRGAKEAGHEVTLTAAICPSACSAAHERLE